MIEARHGRRIPSGRRLARVLADVFRAMLPAARAAVQRGRVPDLTGYEAVLIRVLLPILLHEWQLGREQMRRELKGVGRLRRKAAFPFGGNPPEGLISLVFGSDALPDAVPRAVQQAILALAGSITGSTRQAIRDRLEIGLREGESNGKIADRLTDLFSPQRAYTIAASEASRAMHAGEMSQAQEYGAAGMEWIASSDACELCLPLDGKKVRFGEAFVTLTHGNPAYRSVLHPPAHPRCMCTSTPWWEE